MEHTPGPPDAHPAPGPWRIDVDRAAEVATGCTDTTVSEYAAKAVIEKAVALGIVPHPDQHGEGKCVPVLPHNVGRAAWETIEDWMRGSGAATPHYEAGGNSAGIRRAFQQVWDAARVGMVVAPLPPRAADVLRNLDKATMLAAVIQMTETTDWARGDSELLRYQRFVKALADVLATRTETDEVAEVARKPGMDREANARAFCEDIGVDPNEWEHYIPALDGVLERAGASAGE